MVHGVIENVSTFDNGGAISVDVAFRIDRDVAFDFLDALKPIDPGAEREPILAILNQSSSPSKSRNGLEMENAKMRELIHKFLRYDACGCDDCENWNKCHNQYPFPSCYVEEEIIAAAHELGIDA